MTPPGPLLERRVGGPGLDDRRPLASPSGGEQESPTEDHPAVMGPRFGHELTFFAQLTANLRAEVLGDTPDGYRVNFYVMSGSVRGPDIDATIKPEGGDWMRIRSDGIGEVDITITYETSDGALILERAGGIFDLGVERLAKAKQGEYVGSPPFYATPTWLTASPKWAHLNRLQGFGIGRVVLEKLQVQCDIYIPHVGDRLTA